MTRNTAVTKTVPVPVAEEFVLTRVFDAPRDVVFRAWNDAARMALWWGPRGFTTPFCKVDFRRGGSIHYCMRSPDGKDYWGKGVYIEIAEPKKIVVTDVFSDEKGATIEPAVYGMSSEWPTETTITVTFAEYKGGTMLTVRQSVPEEVAEKTGCRQGWSESLDKLGEYLSQT